MADLSKITLPSGTTYNFKDAQARDDIAALKTGATSGIHYRGVTTTLLTDGASTNPITINNQQYTAKSGDVVIYGKLEFIYSDTDNKWHEFGSTGSLKGLAFKDNATGSVIPSGSVSAPTVTVAMNTASVTSIDGVGTLPSFTEGEFSAGTLPSKAADKFSAGTLPSFTEGAFSAGTLPNLSTSVSNETLIIGFSAGTLPSKAADKFSAGTLPTKATPVSVATSVKSATATAPTFTGTSTDVTVS